MKTSWFLNKLMSLFLSSVVFLTSVGAYARQAVSEPSNYYNLQKEGSIWTDRDIDLLEKTILNLMNSEITKENSIQNNNAIYSILRSYPDYINFYSSNVAIHTNSVNYIGGLIFFYKTVMLRRVSASIATVNLEQVKADGQRIAAFTYSAKKLVISNESLPAKTIALRKLFAAKVVLALCGITFLVIVASTVTPALIGMWFFGVTHVLPVTIVSAGAAYYYKKQIENIEANEIKNIESSLQIIGH